MKNNQITQNQDIKARITKRREQTECRQLDLAFLCMDMAEADTIRIQVEETEDVQNNYISEKGIANRVIEVIKKFPVEARLSDNSTIGSFWDEYKEQIQFEEYADRELYDLTIRSLVKVELGDLSFDELQSLLIDTFPYLRDYKPEDRKNMVQGLEESIVKTINMIAQEEEIQYTNNLEYVSWIDFGDEESEAIAKILKKIGPEMYIGKVYSEFTGPNGEVVDLDISVLNSGCGLRRISKETFDEIQSHFKNQLKSSRLL